MSELDDLENEICDLEKKKAELENRKKIILHARRKEVLDQTRKNISEYAFTMQELGLSVQPNKAGSKAPRKPLQPKYVHPDDPDLKWSGRGRKPKWVQDWIDSGKSEDELRVLK